MNQLAQSSLFQNHMTHLENDLLSPQYALKDFKNKVDVSVFKNNESFEWLQEQIKQLSNIKNFTRTDDYKEWGFLPGQQIYYGGAFGISSLTHHAIYIYSGIILEVGSGSTSECKLGKNMLAFKDQTYGFSTLENFRQRAIKLKSQVAMLVTEKDSDTETIFERLNRANDLLGCYDYNIIENNCQHAANYVSFGVKFSNQAKTAKIIIVSLLVSGALAAVYKKSNHCIRGTCQPRIVTKNKCICSSSVMNAFFSNKKWCYVDDQCKGREFYKNHPFDYVENENPVDYCQEQNSFKFRKCENDS